MTNQIENRMSILSGAFAAPFVDGLYSACENVEVLTELYALLNALCENNRLVRKPKGSVLKVVNSANQRSP